MKALNIKKLFATGLIFAIIFGGSSCQKDEDLKDDCYKLRTDTEFFDISIKAQVQHKDSIPYEGPIRLQLYKTYCNGTISGDFEQSGTTNDEGYFDPHYTYTYKYENLQDKVDLKWYVINESGEEELVSHRTYYYNDAEDEDWLIIYVQDIRLS